MSSTPASIRLFRHAHLLQRGGDLITVFAHADLFVDPGNFAFGVDVDRPALGEGPD